MNYTYIPALCGRQPTPQERSVAQGKYPNLVHCEWSITGEATSTYNCIAWSVGVTNEWFWWEVDDAGDMDGVIEESDFDAFYADYGYVPTDDINQAVILLYRDPAHAAPDNPDGITHAARRAGCNCGAGRWTMFESKRGRNVRIEHRRDQLSGGYYGDYFKGYESQ